MGLPPIGVAVMKFPRRFQQASGPVHREDHPASVAEDRNVNLPFCRPKADVTGPSPSRIGLPVSGQMPVLNLIGGNSSALFSLVLQGFHHRIKSSAVPAEAKICRILRSRRVDHFHYAALRIQRQGIDSLRASERIGAHIYICFSHFSSSYSSHNSLKGTRRH